MQKVTHDESLDGPEQADMTSITGGRLYPHIYQGFGCLEDMPLGLVSVVRFDTLERC